ncbi:MAG: group 1 truncated hemoglobin [Alphaproteobacteria bacterium]|nr:group 1 truncated hemoglobin [Alphaproteobacteria bacterium]
MNTETLFDRIGGEYAINAAVDSFYEKVLSDDLLYPFFEGICMDTQMSSMKSFLTVAFGHGSSETIKNMREVHAPLVEKGLNDTHFDAILGHMTETLQELSIAENLIAEVQDVVESYRDEVLNR